MKPTQKIPDGVAVRYELLNQELVACDKIRETVPLYSPAVLTTPLVFWDIASGIVIEPLAIPFGK